MSDKHGNLIALTIFVCLLIIWLLLVFNEASKRGLI